MLCIRPQFGHIENQLKPYPQLFSQRFTVVSFGLSILGDLLQNLVLDALGQDLFFEPFQLLLPQVHPLGAEKQERKGTILSSETNVHR